MTENGWFEEVSRTAERFLDNIETVVHGKREEIKLVLAALICGGHVLLEDVPGTAKTVLARAIAATIDGATPSRIQCTPDLQPTDVTGLSVFNQRERDFEFRPGPSFAHIRWAGFGRRRRSRRSPGCATRCRRSSSTRRSAAGSSRSSAPPARSRWRRSAAPCAGRSR